jgi:hypothetical protein
LGGQFQQVSTRLVAMVSTLQNTAHAQNETIKSQGEIIKSLQGEITRIGGSGAGRRSVVSLIEKPTQAAPAPTDATGKMSAEAFMAKCDSAIAAGRLSAAVGARVEAYLNRGAQLPNDLIREVLHASGG